MAEERHTKSMSWRCRHLYPVLMVTGPEGERCARCLGCGMLGPSRADLATALCALRESVARPEGAS
jgi:hypothetical protein